MTSQKKSATLMAALHFSVCLIGYANFASQSVSNDGAPDLLWRFFRMRAKLIVPDKPTKQAHCSVACGLR
jgi:hypothetical protein